MGYRVVAQGTSIWDIQRIVSNMNLTKGTKIRIEMETGSELIARGFDAYGAELLFDPFVPDGCDLVDVHSDGTKGVVDLEADPVILDDLLAFIAAHWLGVLVVGVTLALVISAIIISIEAPEAAAITIGVVLLALGAIYILTTPGRQLPWPVKNR